MAKDACYKKVKGRYKVFPSAYASGAIAKCRKVGASNWGNSTKSAATGGLITSPDSRKRPVKKKLRDGGFVAEGCGSVLENNRKETNIY
tara:strand:+ start:662 stop:928 length:267 start_codon:yes stop_codon:yes gene_type:complete